MNYKINDIVEVTNPSECNSFNTLPEAKYIKIKDFNQSGIYYYNILDADKNTIAFCSCFTDADLKPIPKTLETLKEGDRIKNAHGDICTVIGRAGQVIFYEDQNGYLGYYSSQKLKDYGYTVITDSPKKEFTIKEIAEKLGVAPDELVIK